MHARAASVNCETRRSHFNYVRAEVLSVVCQTVRPKSLVFYGCIRPEAKLIRVPKEAYLKSHPRNTLSSAASERFFAAEQTHGHTR